MSMLASYAKKDRAEFPVRGDLLGAIRAYKATSKSVLAELKQRDRAKRSELRRAKEAQARKRRKKIIKALEQRRGPWRPKQGTPGRQVPFSEK